MVTAASATQFSYFFIERYWNCRNTKLLLVLPLNHFLLPGGIFIVVIAIVVVAFVVPNTLGMRRRRVTCNPRCQGSVCSHCGGCANAAFASSIGAVRMSVTPYSFSRPPRGEDAREPLGNGLEVLRSESGQGVVISVPDGFALLEVSMRKEEKKAKNQGIY